LAQKLSFNRRYKLDGGDVVPAASVRLSCECPKGVIFANPDLMSAGGWMHAKMLFVVLMSACHMAFSKWRKAFERDENTHSEKFYRLWNEVPTVLMILIVIMAIAEPF